MNAKNLPMKFALLALLVALALWGTFVKKLKLGIDLLGGSSVIFEIQTNQAEIARLEERQEKLKAELDQATDEKVRKGLEDQLKVLGSQIDNLRQGPGESGNMAEEIIARLKERIDPHGFYNLEFRPLGKTRIEIRMPEADKESRASQQVFTDALDRLKAGNLPRSAIYRVADTRDANQRAALIGALAGADANRADMLGGYAEAMDAVAAASAEIDRIKAEQDKFPASGAEAERQRLRQQRVKAMAAQATAQAKADQLYVQLQRTNVNIAAMVDVLHSYVPTREMAAATEKKTLEERQEYYQDGTRKVLAEHPGRQAEIRAVVAAYEEWARARQRLDDPTDLIRLVRNAGVLEFRIAPEAKSGEVPAEEISRLKGILQDPSEGPESLRRKNGPFLWFPVHPGEDLSRDLITSDAYGRTYVLLYNQPGQMMLQQRGAGGWVLADARPSHDENARPCVSFGFNPMGAKIFGELTGTHIKKPMAILLDDEVFSAPTIQSKISSQGQITGSFTEKDVTQLANILKAGSLPARLNPEPVAISRFGAALGEENLQSALRAGWISALVIIGFMLVYYLLAGAIANAALALNLIMVIGTMGALGSVFTLPGIAGVILVVGMAVDANVLIYERIREEQAKGQSIRMALKNGYERAFSAIFDSNITTLISAAILGWVGTEEIQGFAITLGLGVVFNIFSAVWVTRWVFQFLLERGWMNRPVRMLKIIGVPKIDWMAKRYYFWAFSLITMILGLAAFFWQGKDILGIEFVGGTEAVITFKDDALIGGKLPDDALVREQFAKAAAGHEKLSSTARVERVNTNRVADFIKAHDPNGTGQVTLQGWIGQRLNEQFFRQLADRAGRTDTLSVADLEDHLPAKSYQISTTETGVPLIQRVAAQAFGDALAQRQRIDFDLDSNQFNKTLNVDLDANGPTLITKALAEKADRRYRGDLLDAEGGVLMVVRLRTPATQAEVMDRLRDVGFQPDFSKVAQNPVTVLGLTSFDSNSIKDSDKYMELAVVVTPSDPAMGTRSEAWFDFAQQEYRYVEESLHRQNVIVAINFDAPTATQAQQRAIVAIILAWMGIIAYLWVRFRQFRWGLAAVLCLVHDVTIVVGMVAISGWLKGHAPGLCGVLAIDSFKIDLTMVAAILTIIGYSVNDTIVVFDRIRENRGRLVVVTPKIINDSINQTMSRTLLTNMTVWAVVLIMYIWGGQGIHAFSYAMLVGAIVGTYSSIAVASPMLLGFKGMMVVQDAAPAPEAASAAK